VILPGSGFGTGTHETTQLCLQALGHPALLKRITGQEVLDFGSGSGILSLAAARLGASQVWGVEIDDLAIANARENASLNGLEGKVTWKLQLEEVPAQKRFPVILANILRPVLVEFVEPLLSRRASGGAVIVSGLLERDVEEVKSVYSARLGGQQPEVLALGEWRALVWR
jgi:ribosomal protein L11 methyltransferase